MGRVRDGMREPVHRGAAIIRKNLVTDATARNALIRCQKRGPWTRPGSAAQATASRIGMVQPDTPRPRRCPVQPGPPAPPPIRMRNPGIRDSPNRACGQIPESAWSPHMQRSTESARRRRSRPAPCWSMPSAERLHRLDRSQRLPCPLDADSVLQPWARNRPQIGPFRRHNAVLIQQTGIGLRLLPPGRGGFVLTSRPGVGYNSGSEAA